MFNQSDALPLEVEFPSGEVGDVMSVCFEDDCEGMEVDEVPARFSLRTERRRDRSCVVVETGYEEVGK